MTHSFDALILGGGAAGLMCAIEAGKRGRRVAVLERADRLGKKILISGGGRCNFTNLQCRPENFISSNPHFAKSALARYTPADFIALVEKHGISYHEKTLGQLFCDHSARDVLAMLESECHQAGVTIFLNAKIREVEQTADFVVRTASEEFSAAALVVATGGLSIPKIGATSFGYDLARQFGLKIREPWPGLVPFVLDAEDCARYCDLAGVSADVIASSAGQRFREKMLVTHRGLSGPAILQASSYWKKPQPILIDLAPGREVTAAFRDPATPRTLAALRAELRKFLPHRLADRWLEAYAPTSWTNQALRDLEKQLHAWTISPAGTEGFEKAEVTAGGVDTDELSAKTMETRTIPGLFFIGEVVDVTGHLGGFNFQWAWASGAAAGRAL
ncbi:MAG TPA: NAD(P)/FAD-dependent oxidoreductase [Candidatus Acidoferrum sp.]|jgi:predicted Rossmann fold flavoprotein|nr:NAD(P)/FAD-dependent oxidoreductase [Candidatus Acidoferrum sp.]